MRGFVNESLIGTFLYIAEGHVNGTFSWWIAIWKNLSRAQKIIYNLGTNYSLHSKLYLKEMIRDVPKNV